MATFESEIYSEQINPGLAQAIAHSYLSTRPDVEKYNDADYIKHYLYIYELAMHEIQKRDLSQNVEQKNNKVRF